MNHTDHSNSSESEQLLKRIQSIEKRISRIEHYLGSIKFTRGDLSSASSNIPQKDHTLADFEKQEDNIELRVGESGLAWLGSIVLLLAISFLISYTKNIGHGILASLIGYSSALCILGVSHLLLKPFPHLVFVLKVSAHLLLYYVTLQLHFFTPQPLIQKTWINILLLTTLTAAQTYIAVRIKSELFGGMALLLILSTAIFSDSPLFQFPLLLISTIIAMYFFYRFSWLSIFLGTLFFVYFSHLFFLLGNPIMGHPLKQITNHEFNLFYLVGYFGIFSLVALFKQKFKISENLFILLTIWNGIFFSFLLTVNIFAFFQENYLSIFSLLSLLFLIYSIILKAKKSDQFEISFYACLGFMALSVSVYAYSPLPNTFLWLALQSLLVVSIALWYKSRIITVVNTILLLGILIYYLAYNHPSSATSFSFALVAFGSARILNWKKERLSLQTDLMRNIYLSVFLIMMLYGLFHAVPKKYITLSWTAAAGLFFLISILLHNFKYRWLAICTLFITVVYLFIVDLAHMDLVYRVFAFFFLAIISLGVSFYYTKKIKKK